ncbi:pyruvate kinase [Anaerobranca californiensis DSM 14826]|jgi:pyruvate kinase|uniref:Pyruvate kinase n=1 Tax=Anaerobranca californiensis DSM 14826 TaxID=1120989 RepID=A0A1M6MHY4_9FIRM|nr:pyruvate kinase [Anaerobranca californiensis]SHJ83082.1 pyruvate kinase [Anaerobranca californiensis DSM 14826]
MRRTKIVCTIGPASESPEMLKKLILAGMNVARLNFSHGDYEEHGRRIATIRQVAKELNKNVAILLDTKGPEIRIKKFAQGKIQLNEGDIFTLTTEDILGDETKVAITYEGLPADVKKGDRILLDDGLIALEVLETTNTDIKCKVLNGGPLSDKKGVNVPGVSVSLPAMSDKDLNDIKFGIEQGVDFIAASFIRKASDVLAIRRVLEEHNSDIHIISKIENQEGLDNLDEILKVSDGLMVARGDLGVEIPVEEVPLAQKLMIEKCNKAGKPVITATQMLDSMIRNPRPTRAEASDVANAIFDGTDAIMLSGETAAGKYPEEAVKTMAQIAERAEQAVRYEEILGKKTFTPKASITDSISSATCNTAQSLGASAIITSTQSGYTAKMVSKYRPKCPIIAVTPDERVVRKLVLSWGVFPVLGKQTDNTDDMIAEAIKTSLEHGYIKEGDLVVITAGVPVGIAGTTNLLKVHVVGDVIVKGTGIGNNSVQGKVIVAKTAKELINKKGQGDILVTNATDSDLVPNLEGIKAIVAEEAGLTSTTAIVGLSKGIPVVVGASGATSLLKDGEEVTVDPQRGLVYRGLATVK